MDILIKEKILIICIFFIIKVRAVNVTMRAFQKAGQFQLSSVTDGLLARRRYTKKSTDSCSSTSSSTTTSTSSCCT